jgi:fatty acid desaturase
MWWLKPVVWLLRAIILVGVTSIIHECIHGLFARAKWVNRWVGAIAAAALLKNYTLHRAFHLRHHSRTTKDDDPEPRVGLQSIRDYLRLAARRGNILFTTRTSWHGTWCALHGCPPHYLSGKELTDVRVDALIEFLWLAAMLGGLIFFPGPVIYGYLIPLCISPLLAFFVFLPEHYATTSGSSRAVDNTRTIRSNAIFRFLFWNNNYHAEHHAFPGVPFFNLPRLHGLMADQISYSAGSYTRFHLDLLRQLRVGVPVAGADQKQFMS